MTIRVGNGFDAHKLNEGTPLFLGGILIPSKKGSLGHSDGDVLIHSIVDAIFGALAIGDLGLHFPSSDNKWKDAPDEWGLDIMRVDADGEALEFTASSGAGNETWYDTLTKGKIDWAFYQDSKIYQKAKEVLGLEGYYTESGLGVEGIRKANVWVHGQAALIAEGGPDWTQWKPPEDWKKEYKAEPLPITGYTPDDLKTPKTPKDISGPPTINIPDVTIKRPANLDKKIGKIVGEE